MEQTKKTDDFDFQELIRDREDWVKSSKKNKFDFDGILVGLYNDPSHFIFEILQNAEDEGAKSVSFKLDENQLEISHDGEDFNTNDIAAITGIGVSTKKDDINAIGKFGVGFKSVFAITQSPIILSGKYHFEINDFVVPSPLDKVVLNQSTNIILPFNHKSRSKNQVFSLVQDKLENLGLQSLLFLKNIEEVKWLSPSKSGHYLKSSKTVDSTTKTKRVTIISTIDDEESIQEQSYLIFEKDFAIDKKSLKVEVAFRLEKDDKTESEKIVPVNNAKLTVYFPTEKDTYLKFLIQGPYKTTQNRENIPLNDEQNLIITDQIGELVCESISVLKRLGYLDLNFLNVLPIEKEHVQNNPIFSTIYGKVKSKFLSKEELLPTSEGGFITADKALLARGQDLLEVFDKADIQRLFNKDNWLDTNITYDRTRGLRDYLISALNVQEVEFETFAQKFTDDFFAAKSDEWMINLYSRLSGQSSLWRDGKSYPYKKGILRRKPFIRLEDGSHVIPFNETDGALVYLPSQAISKYPTVKKILTDDQEALKFLQLLGLSEPDIFAEIKEFIIPKYKADKPNIEVDEYFEDFSKLLIAFKDSHQYQQKRDFLDGLKGLPIIKAINPVTRQTAFVDPVIVYANTIDLRLYFDKHETVNFISDELYSKFDTQVLNDFLKELGVSNQLRRISFHPDLSTTPEFRTKLQEYSGQWVNRQDVFDYDLDGLDNFLKRQITLEKSKSLWNLLIEIVESKQKSFFEGEYKWKYYKNRFYRFPASFTRKLQQNRWLFDLKNNICSPFEIGFSEISDEYNIDFSKADDIKELLKFKSEIIDQLPEDEKNILELTKGRSAEEIKKALDLFDEQNNPNESWEPPVNPDVPHPSITIVDPPELPPLIILPPSEGGPGGSIPDPKPTDKKLKDIGKWGEKYVFNVLQTRLGKNVVMTPTEYGSCISNNEIEQEIHWLNIEKDEGKGCDFYIIQENEKVEYIEVKTTTDDKKTLFMISGTQWGLAKKLFDSGEGYKYIIYRVFNAGTEDARIEAYKDPIKLWKEGKLYAHPIQLKF